ncbi:MAG: hypothetical protein IH825_00390 [Candidatus Marinimicrobia bacterium]|nr:hypothetical protein [Candidatus Neomarinimicrobiota bacterium]
MKEILKAVILPAVIGFVGTYASYTYNQAKLNVDYARTIHSYLPQIHSDNLYEQQVALVILKPILNKDQLEALEAVIDANQKSVIIAAAGNDAELEKGLNRLAALTPEKALDLKNYSRALILERESMELFGKGNVKEAIEKLRSSAKAHPDFEEYSEFAENVQQQISITPDLEELSSGLINRLDNSEKNKKSLKVQNLLNKLKKK